MPKQVNKVEEENKKRKLVEEASEDSSEEESSEDSGSSDSSNSDSDSDSNSSESEEGSYSSDSDSSDSEDEKSKSKAKSAPKKEDKGKAKVPEVPQNGTKHKRSDEESAKEQASIQPEKKKAKSQQNATNGQTNGQANGQAKHANGQANGSANGNANGGHKAVAKSSEVSKWREENNLTVVNIEDSSVDTSAPFTEYSETPFPDYVLSSIKAFGFKKPTPIQAQTWPLTAKGRDVVGIAETGSGKTLAFGYPGIIKIKKSTVKGPKMLVLAPTRELAQQIHEVLAKACEHASLSACCVYGGADKKDQARLVAKADIVCATPGRLIDLIQDGSANLKNVHYLVLDEADRMLEMGFIPQIRTIIETIPKERQTLMFSATWPVDVQKFAYTYLINPIQITIGGEKLSGAKKISQIVEVCGKEGDRRTAIKRLLKRLCASETRPRILVFMLYKKTCDALCQELQRDNWNVDCLHGDKNQAARDKAVVNFKSGATHILIATDVAARGLDIKDIKFVINGEMPLVMEDYIHRIGRTGRAGESGSAYTIFSPEDKVHARQLVRILEEGSHPVPSELAKIAETAPVTKPRKSTMEILYGDFAKGADAEQMMKKPTKITFD